MSEQIFSKPTGDQWVPENPDDVVRLIYVDVFMDVPRVALLNCKRAVASMEPETRDDLKAASLQWLALMRRTPNTAKLPSEITTEFARALIQWHAIEEFAKASKR